MNCEICGKPTSTRLCITCAASLQHHDLDMARLRQLHGRWIYVCTDEPLTQQDTPLYHYSDCDVCRAIAGRKLLDQPNDPHAQCLAKLFEPAIVVTTARQQAA